MTDQRRLATFAQMCGCTSVGDVVTTCPTHWVQQVETAPPEQQAPMIAAEIDRVLACDCFPHGPDEPCTCDGCWACAGHVIGCTCDIAWDCEHRR